jgi:hypothetical protein
MTTLNDGRSVAFALNLAKAFSKAVRSPHRVTDVRQSGYGPATFDVAMIDEEDGLPNGRFATVTVEITRDAGRAEHLRAEMEGES